MSRRGPDSRERPNSQKSVSQSNEVRKKSANKKEKETQDAKVNKYK